MRKNKIVNPKSRYLILFGLFLSLVSGCGSSSPSKTAAAEIEFWTMQLQPKFTQYFNELNQDFVEDREFEIRWVDIPWSAMESKILTAISANTAPDVVNLNPNFAAQLATRNVWTDIDQVVPAEKQAAYLPKIWKANSIDICRDESCDTSTFGIPWYLTTRVTIYNRQLLKNAGVVKAPQNYQELAIAAKEIKTKTGKYAFFVTFVPGDSAEVLESMVQMGVTLLDDEGKSAFNNADGVAAFRYWVDLYQQKLLPPEVLTQGHRYAVELYQGGQTAFLSSGAEFLDVIATNAPNIAKVSATSSQITGKTGKINVAVMNLAIPRNTDKPKEALDYALHLTNAENQLAFAKAANVLPSNQAAVKTYIQELSEQDTTTAIEEARKVSAMQLENAEILIPARDDLQLLQKVIYENLQAAMLGEKTVEKAVEDAAKQWDESL